jgi:hypothetical protein
MISANTAEMLRAAQILAEQARIIEQNGLLLERGLIEKGAAKRFLIFFKKPLGDIERLAKKRKKITDALMAQSLYLRECAKCYRGVQSRAVVRSDMI